MPKTTHRDVLIARRNMRTSLQAMIRFAGTADAAKQFGTLQGETLFDAIKDAHRAYGVLSTWCNRADAKRAVNLRRAFAGEVVAFRARNRGRKSSSR